MLKIMTEFRLAHHSCKDRFEHKLSMSSKIKGDGSQENPIDRSGDASRTRDQKILGV